MKYFDYAATTPPYPEVVRAMGEMMQQHYGNPSSLHRYGEEADRLLRRAREVSAGVLGVQPGELIWTSGATESNNLALKGAAMRRGRLQGHIITTAIEHASVYEACRQLEQLGFEVSYLDAEPNGTISLERIQAAFREDTILFSMMHVNNETGAVQPIMEVARWIKKYHPRTIVHVDGVQGFGRLAPFPLGEGSIDLYSLSAHKLRGPRGVGLLYVKQGTELLPLLAGGGQENGYRSGTENVAAIAGMTKALRLSAEKQTTQEQHLRLLSAELRQQIRTIPGLLLTEVREVAPHIVHFTYPGMKAEVVLHSLEQQGMLVSTQSACASRRAKPSRVLRSMGMDAEAAMSGIRISLGDEHTAEDITQLVAALRQTVQALRPLERR
ncbi:cysteine desulfurase family protein [Paenibacillus hunanensis]|uniref:Cysteine desulfurase n=1 Tax=Paenibacillus hunanensis TaxID=539262 RepID=A0ABU1J3I5_9BACL|nr:cysteine desulfurase family protein [Paenibacillus hunanensis]MDR6245761.1 cysteine desulfurase [Paenibacillus hunanensis]GGJ19507.1 aminotransferase V [Paenibacillus hunanensis]